MKRRSQFIAVVITCFALVFVLPPLSGGRAHAAQKVYNIKIANFFPGPAKQSHILEQFGQELQARSGGRIKVQYFPGGSLLTGPAMYNGIVNGIADIGYTHVFYTPGRMPITEGLGLPLGVPSGWVGAHMAYDWYTKFKPKEFRGVRILSIEDNAPSMVISKTPVRTLEDMKGLKIRAPSLSGDIVRALGGTPTPTPMMETYDSILKGVNDGVWGPYEVLKTFRFAEVAKYLTVNWQIGACFPFYMAMNQRKYDSLPPDLQGLVDTLSGEYQERYALMWNEIELEGKAFALTKGMHFIELSDQEAAKWQKAAEPVIDNWIKKMVAKGHSEAEVKGWIAYMRDRIKYWTAMQMQYKVPSPTGPAGMRPEAYVIKE